MMRMRELTSVKEKNNELEVRPGGMLVQKRDPDEALNRIPPPTIRVRVKYGSIYQEMIINSTATFGELKKMLSGPTGLHHEDQKIIYKNKERASKTFLDVVGVKDRSKMVLLDDPVSREKRYVEARRNAKIAKAAKAVSDIGLEVDRLAGQVSALELVISKGGKVADETMSNLIELLMNQLLKLDEIKVDGPYGDVNQQKKLQVEKVQKFVETLDVLKIRNTKRNRVNNGVTTAPNRHQSGRSVEKFAPIAAASQQREVSSKNTSRGVVVTTQWETFDSLPTIIQAPPSTSTSTSITGETKQHNFNWDLLLK
ncbi:putative Ubiquitin-like domain, BAG domain, Ubiquitin-like domain superfamily [Helianthus annuus]|nr:putative Ubiquitin-like domain, BAG domain, Ubiquitin-like domain superfamily [Helianthus annuus]